jgi:hypothetical protein
MLIIDLQGFSFLGYPHLNAFSHFFPAFLAEFWRIDGRRFSPT